jgi:hypothetical protein
MKLSLTGFMMSHGSRSVVSILLVDASAEFPNGYRVESITVNTDEALDSNP